MPLYDQVELLCQAVASQATGEAATILSQAREEADRRVADAEARRREALARTTAEVEAQARLAARNRVDRAELEGKRRVAQAKETCLGEVFDQAWERLLALRGTPAYGDWLRQALLAAVRQLEGEDFRVVANPGEEKWLTADLLAAVGRERDCRLTFAGEAELAPGGFVLVRGDGRVRVDQTFQGIIDRQRETLRAETARKLWGD